jgi:hypothetical protein
VNQPAKPKSVLPPSRRPAFQFSLMGLMVAMFVVAAATAPAYYLMRGAGAGSVPHARLIGMLMMLAGPLLLMTVLSVLLALTARRR